jgi:CRISPR-associated protein Cas1
MSADEERRLVTASTGMPDAAATPGSVFPADQGAAAGGLMLNPSSADPDHVFDDPGALLPARMLNEFVYCPRLFFLEHVQREFAHSEDTLAGRLVHRRVDEERGVLPPADELESHDRIVASGVLLASERVGLIARIDLLEGEGGEVRPVDYKKGAPGRDGPWEPERVQLCAQGLILEDGGYRCSSGVLYYAATRQRFVVPFDAALRQRTLEAAGAARETASQPLPPPPLVDSPKCPRCSLVGICLPDEVNLLRGIPLGEVRRLVPARDEAGPVYVLEQGATIGKQGERLIVRRRDGSEESVRLLDASHVCLYGNAQISPQAIRELAEREIPIFHLTYGGWLAAVTTGVHHRNVELRVRQYRMADDDSASLRLARALVGGKIRNQRTLLRRNAREGVDGAVRELARLARRSQEATSAGELLGIEGAAARAYFACFGCLLRDAMGFDFHARVRRPPTDPVNALLSFLYSLLVKECISALLGVGLDPYRGVYHRLRYGRPSLALDLAEEFRPLIGDSTVLTVVNNGMVDQGSFVRRGPSCALNDRARRRVVEALEERLDVLIRHPVFGYAVSYRRVVVVQARLLGRTIAGEVGDYKPFTTR